MSESGKRFVVHSEQVRGEARSYWVYDTKASRNVTLSTTNRHRAERDMETANHFGCATGAPRRAPQDQQANPQPTYSPKHRL